MAELTSATARDLFRAARAALLAAAEAFSVTFLSGRPFGGRILINGKESTGMSIPVHKFTYEVQYQDDLKDVVPGNAPTLVEVVDLTGAISLAATLTPDLTNDQKGEGIITDIDLPFKLRSTMGTMVLESDELDPVPGAPVTGVMIVTPVA